MPCAFLASHGQGEARVQQFRKRLKSKGEFVFWIPPSYYYLVLLSPLHFSLLIIGYTSTPIKNIPERKVRSVSNTPIPPRLYSLQFFFFLDTMPTDSELTLGIHRGAIDQTTITTQPPSKVMKHVNKILQEMGVQIQEESVFNYRCIRASNNRARGVLLDIDHQQQSRTDDSSSSASGEVSLLYGAPTEDLGDEVRFSVELTRLGGLSDTYSLDIRRLKGNLRSYKFIYDTIRK